MYTVADWIPGLSLPAALESTSAASGLLWVSEVARATSYLHDFRSGDAPEGLIHRDIKPSNVRIASDERAVLIDFGIARPHQKGDLTEGAGTYLWRAPEIVGGPGDPGPASDVWGVGALAYWVLLGEPPRLEGADSARKVLEPAASHADFVDPAGLSSCISELLETHPKDRPTDLERWADELELSMAGKRRRRMTNRRIGLVAAATVALIAVAAVVVLAGQSGTAASKSAVFAFKPQSFPSGLIVDRTWTLSGSTGDHLDGSAILSNGTAKPILANYHEVLPKSVASNVDRIKFSPPPSVIVKPDPVVSYPVALAAGKSEKIGFSVNVGPTDGDRAARMRQLANAQEEAEASYLASNHLAAPATLKTMQITPSTLTLMAGQSKPLALTGTMSNGAPANQRELSGIAWNSSAPAVATAADGVVSGLTTGDATVTAQAGSVRTSVNVRVDAPEGQSSSLGGSDIRAGSSGPNGVKNPGTGGASGATTTTSKAGGSSSGGSSSGGSSSGGSSSGGSSSGGSSSGGSSSGGSSSGGSSSGGSSRWFSQAQAERQKPNP